MHSPCSTGPPDAPVVTQTGATLDSVTVSWTEAGSNPLYPVTGYYVLFNGTATMVGLNRTYVITGLMSGTTYSVGVRGRNAAGEGEVGSVNASTPNPLGESHRKHTHTHTHSVTHTQLTHTLPTHILYINTQLHIPCKIL